MGLLLLEAYYQELRRTKKKNETRKMLNIFLAFLEVRNGIDDRVIGREDDEDALFHFPKTSNEAPFFRRTFPIGNANTPRRGLDRKGNVNCVVKSKYSVN